METKKQGDMMILQCSKRPGRHEEWKGTNHHHLLAEFVLGILQGEVTRKPSNTHLDQQMSPALYEAYIGLLPSASCDLSAPDSKKQPATNQMGMGNQQISSSHTKETSMILSQQLLL
jgi:hypothetical protein